MVLFIASLVGLIEAIIFIHQKYSIPDHFINYFAITRELILSIILLNALCFALFLIGEGLKKLLFRSSISYTFFSVLWILYYLSWLKVRLYYMSSFQEIFLYPKIELLIVGASIVLSWVGVYSLLKYIQSYEDKIVPFFIERFSAFCIPVLVVIATILYGLLKIKKYSSFAYVTGILCILFIFLFASYFSRKIVNAKKGSLIIILLNIIVLPVVVYSFMYDIFPSSRGEIGKHQAAFPNIVVITVDALRQDHVSCYKKGNAHTPVIDTIAKSGVIFENARSASSWTIPSFSSFVTSLYPSAIGQLNGKGDIKVPTSIETFPEVLKKHGYTNYVFSIPFVQRKSIGIAQGIDYLIEIPYYSWYENEIRQITLVKGWIPENFLWDAHYMNESVMKFVGKLKKPFFVWIHYKDPHAPYTLPAIQEDPLMKKTRYPTNFLDIRTGYFALNHAEKLKIKKFYALEVEYTDKMIGELLTVFEMNGYLNNAFVVVAADHGEEFWDHNNVMHGHSLYEEIVRIPLIIKFPDNKLPAQRITTNVNLMDVAPTILSYIEVRPPYRYQGIDLSEVIREPEKFADRVLFAENLQYYNENKAVIKRNDKLIFSDDGYKLFDLSKDPGELSPVFDREKIHELVQLMTQWQKENEKFRFSHGISVSSDNAYGDELKNMLKSLGYVQ